MSVVAIPSEVVVTRGSVLCCITVLDLLLRPILTMVNSYVCGSVGTLRFDSNFKRTGHIRSQ